jgi:thioredoxin reductase (NADPH)
VALDGKGFVLTGAEAASGRRLLETSRRGVFAIGDVRSGSVKRVAAAVGEGAQVVAQLHAFLAGTSAAVPPLQPYPSKSNQFTVVPAQAGT